jgi:hypothetical protein
MGINFKRIADKFNRPVIDHTFTGFNTGDLSLGNHQDLRKVILGQFQHFPERLYPLINGQSMLRTHHINNTT